MKTNKLNEKIDDIAMIILLFVPFVILVIIEGVKALLKFLGVRNDK